MKKIFSYLLPMLLIAIQACEPAKETTKENSTDTASKKNNKPIDKGNGIYAYDFNGLYLEVDANRAGKVSVFSLDGVNFFSTDKTNKDNWGNSLWTSPQSAWGWPPSKQIDVLPYTTQFIDSTSIELTSQKDSLLGYVVKKKYALNTKDTAVVITYTITNASDKKQKVAPWEITRVAPGGITLYPSGKTKKTGMLAPLTSDTLGITWLPYIVEKIPSGDPSKVVPKLLSDGSEGWIAQVNNGYIFIKKFNDVPADKIAPGEGEIELYTNPDKSYMEIEQQGEYTELMPSQSLTWTITWYLKKLPASVNPTIGNPQLIEYIRNIVK
jgi:hypothetical protein